jgi:hypothetical protein
MKVVIPDKYRITKEYVDERIDERANETEEEVLKTTQEYIDDKLKDFQMGEVEGLEEVIQQAESNSQKIEEIKSDLENFKCDCGDELKDRIDTNELNINKILEFVDEPPSYVKPTLSISLSESKVEHNIYSSVDIIPNFIKNDAGEIESYVLKKNGSVFYRGELKTYSDYIALSHGDFLEYEGIVYYGDGEIKNTAFGVEYPSTSIKAGQISAKKKINAYARTYHGKIKGDVVTESDIAEMMPNINTSKSNTLTYTLKQERSVLVYPKSFGELTTIKDANNFEYINSYTKTEITYKNIEYYVYMLTDAVTITDFKQIFN